MPDEANAAPHAPDAEPPVAAADAASSTNVEASVPHAPEGGTPSAAADAPKAASDSVDDMRKNKAQRCSLCGNPGHKSRTCKAPIKRPVAQNLDPRKNKLQRCSTCGTKGHKARSCTFFGLLQKENKEGALGPALDSKALQQLPALLAEIKDASLISTDACDVEMIEAGGDFPGSDFPGGSTLLPLSRELPMSPGAASAGAAAMDDAEAEAASVEAAEVALCLGLDFEPSQLFQGRAPDGDSLCFPASLRDVLSADEDTSDSGDAEYDGSREALSQRGGGAIGGASVGGVGLPSGGGGEPMAQARRYAQGGYAQGGGLGGGARVEAQLPKMWEPGQGLITGGTMGQGPLAVGPLADVNAAGMALIADLIPETASLPELVDDPLAYLVDPLAYLGWPQAAAFA